MMGFCVFGEQLGWGTGFQVVEVYGPNNIFLLFNHHIAARGFFYRLIYDSSFGSQSRLWDITESFEHLPVCVQLINNVKCHCLLLLFKHRWRGLLLHTFTIYNGARGVIRPDSGNSIHGSLNIQLFNPLRLCRFDVSCELPKTLFKQLVFQILGVYKFEPIGAVFLSLTEKTISSGLCELLIYILG